MVLEFYFFEKIIFNFKVVDEVVVLYIERVNFLFLIEVLGFKLMLMVVIVGVEIVCILKME